MGQSFFIWNGVDCRSKGIILRGPVPIVRAEERVKHVEIPGKSGDLTETEGENIFNSYIQTATISVRGGYRVNEIYKWLRGEGYVTFSGEPQRRQKARVIGAITLNRHSRNLDYWEGEVQFYCQPLKENIYDETRETFTSSGNTIRNNGDVMALPLFKCVTNAANFSLTITGDNAPADNTLAVIGITSGNTFWVDSDTMEVYTGSRTHTITEKSAGEFPRLGVGNNTFTFSGCSRIEVEKRERFL